MSDGSKREAIWFVFSTILYLIIIPLILINIILDGLMITADVIAEISDIKSIHQKINQGIDWFLMLTEMKMVAIVAAMDFARYEFDRIYDKKDFE